MMGFTFHILGDRDEGGLAIDGSNDRTCFAFHQSALGVAVGIAPSTEVNYIAEKTSFWTDNTSFWTGKTCSGWEKIVCLEELEIL